MTRKSNTTAIIQLSKEKSEKTRIRVEKTISEMAIKKRKLTLILFLKKQMFQSHGFTKIKTLELELRH